MANPVLRVGNGDIFGGPILIKPDFPFLFYYIEL